MKHVTHRLEAWLGGELAAGEAAAVEAHLAACDHCRSDADDLRDVWEILDTVAAPDPAASVWPGVRNRTVASPGGTWFFGTTPALRAGLATLAMAAGLLAAVLLPGSSPTVADEAADAGFWLDGTSWASDDNDALDGLWLAAGTDLEEKQ